MAGFNIGQWETILEIRKASLVNKSADFVCFEKMLIIEIDGESHASDKGIVHDEKRSAFLKSRGYQVIRFWNNDVLENIDGVMEIIRNECLT